MDKSDARPPISGGLDDPLPWISMLPQPKAECESFFSEVGSPPPGSARIVVLAEAGWLSRMETLLLTSFATARSGFPSPFRSPMATMMGLDPTVKFVAAPKEPVPSPKYKWQGEHGQD